jgi:putative flippase GtrA
LFRQGARFAISGTIVSIVYIAATTLLAGPVGLPFQVGLAVGFLAAITVHFTLQRTFVWTHQEDFALSLHHQAGRYLLSAGAQYGATAAGTALLPSALGLPTELVYLMVAPLMGLANFFVFRHRVFHAGPVLAASTPGPVTHTK